MKDTRRARRLIGIVGAVALLSTVFGTTAAVAKAKPKKTTKKKVVATTAKRPTATTAPAATAAKGVIKLGAIGSAISATTGAKSPEETKEVARAWADQVNSAGGINGYKVQVTYKDAAGDSARMLQAVKELDKEGVVAIAGLTASTQITGSMSYINDKKIPIIGGASFTEEYDMEPLIFQTSSSHFAGVYSMVAAARDAGAKHFRNAYCIEVAVCASSVPITKYAAQREGLKFSSQSSSITATDYTVVCLSAKTDGVDFLQLNGLNMASMVRDCTRQGYHPSYSQGGAPTRATIDQLRGEDYTSNLFEFGYFYNGPEVQRFKQLVAKTSVSDVYGQTSVQTWLGMEMAGAIIKKLTKPNPTRADFLAATQTVKGETLGGQIAPVDYTVQQGGKHFQNDCWTEYKVVDGAFVHITTSGQVTANKLSFICNTGTHNYPAP